MHSSKVVFRLLGWAFVLGLLLSAEVSAARQVTADIRALAATYFPGTEVVQEFSGEPEVARVYGRSQLLGYLAVTDDVAPIQGYSGAPITTLVGISTDGHIAGVRILAHQEPILGAGVTARQLDAYIEQYAGHGIDRQPRIGAKQGPDDVVIDGLTGATITAMVINQTIDQTVREVALSRGLLLAGKEATVQLEESAEADKPVVVWTQVWHERRFEVATLIVGLLVLLVILTFQEMFVRHPALLARLRNGYLLFTLFFIGWWAHGQLSVINVLTFSHALFGDFRWETYLLDPIIFILWGFVAVTLLLWGRGIFCGWLCPFGALQELLHNLGRRIGLTRNWEPPQLVHQRLEAVKYIIFLGLFGISLPSIGALGSLIEVEPFATVFVLSFQRETVYVVYALALLGLALFVRKFFCRYLCPLGAALAIPAKLRLFDWLPRRKECGRPCQICAVQCGSRAIRQTGEINANECHYCLDCHVIYGDKKRCPPLVAKDQACARSVKIQNLKVEAEERGVGPA